MNAIAIDTIGGRIDVMKNDGGVTLNAGPICLLLKTSQGPTLDQLLPTVTWRLAHGDNRPLYMECGIPGSPLLRIFAGVKEDIIYIAGGGFVLRLSIHDCEPLADAIVKLMGDAP